MTQILQRRFETRVWIVLSLLVSLQFIVFSELVWLYNFYTQYPSIRFIHIPFLFLVSPLLYLYFNHYIYAYNYNKTNKAIHFIPTIFATILTFPYYFLNQEMQSKLFHYSEKIFVFRTQQLSFLYFYKKILDSMIILPEIIFLIYAFQFLAKYYFTLKSQLKSISTLCFFGLVLYLIITSIIAFIAQITFHKTIVLLEVIFLSLFVILLYFISVHDPSFIETTSKEIIRKYEYSRISTLKVDSILNNLKKIMEEEKAFCDEDITLPKLALELNISTHQLSEILNAKIGKNFHTFINEYRIEEAKKLLLIEANRNILSIAMAVGFNSKASFNKA
ncbi:MAG: helix-turn-helix domain-containing protein, partial [Leptospiraceae bacterium]|nr:helix-turn-helix domain-containing protein [Leptospiraceae bacterium]